MNFGRGKKLVELAQLRNVQDESPTQGKCLSTICIKYKLMHIFIDRYSLIEIDYA